MTYPERVQKLSLLALVAMATLTLVGALLAGAGLPTGYLAGFSGIGVALCGVVHVAAKRRVARQRVRSNG